MRRLKEVLENETGQSQTSWGLFRTPVQWVAAVLGSAVVESLITTPTVRVLTILVLVVVAITMFFIDKSNRPVGTAILLRGHTGEHQDDLWNAMRAWVTKPFRYVYQFSTPLPDNPAQWAGALDQLATQLAVSLDPNQGGPIDRNARKSVLLNMPITCAFWLGSRAGSRHDKLEVLAQYGQGFERVHPTQKPTLALSSRTIAGTGAEGLAVVFLVESRTQTQIDMLVDKVRGILVIDRPSQMMNGSDIYSAVSQSTQLIETFVGTLKGRVTFVFDGPAAMAFSLGQNCRLFAGRFDLLEHDRTTNTYQKVAVPEARL